jgi:ABC-type transport system involved in cytochrome c biogenesis permease subunit
MSRATPAPRPHLLLWFLAALALVLSVGIVALAGSLLRGRPADAPAPRHIAVPFEEQAELWEPFRRWVVQEDGRNKPFDTFCREAVRAVTGRERFEEVRSRVTGRRLAPGHDPVAVVVSWLMLYDPDPATATELAARAGCDWENHPFLYCPSPELRRLLGADESGSHIAPALLRRSPEFVRLLRQAAQAMAEDGKAPLPPPEAAAVELKGRLDLYDRLRAGGEVEDGRERPRLPGEFGVVALDRVGRTWFGLQSLRAYADASPAVWGAALQRRRLDDLILYEGTPPQPLPAAEVREVLDAYAALQEAYRGGDAGRFADAGGTFLEIVGRVSGQFNRYPDTDTVERELWYNRVGPFRKAWLLGLLAVPLLGASLLVGGRWPRAGRLLYAAGLLACLGLMAWAAAGFYCRVTISDRPPVSNMYESIVWVAFVTAGFGLVLEAIYRWRVIALAAAVVAALGLILADTLPLTFSPSIQPLQAVLRSNYWLIVHVLVIVSSYAPLALAWVLGNVNLLLILYAPSRRDLVQALSGFCYRTIQAGVVLLFLGTMLGGFWAAESWGRFWGWDPKEVWALIAFLCYIIPLHARYAGWVGDFGLAASAVACFASVVMAWYGVNFVLGAGLHSYGFGSGDHRWVYLAGLVNLALVVLAGLRYVAVQPRAA